MNPEDQCISLELAKKLKELSIEQDSLFCWFRCGGDVYELDYNTHDDIQKFPHEYISAFTTQELWALIPVDCFFHLTKNEGKTSLYFQPNQGTDNSYCFTDDNLANNIANMIVAYPREAENI